MVGAGAERVELAAPAAVAAEFGDAAAEPAGRSEYLAAVELTVTSLAAAAARLNALPGVRGDASRIVVPAGAAFNTTLVF